MINYFPIIFDSMVKDNYSIRTKTGILEYPFNDKKINNWISTMIEMINGTVSYCKKKKTFPAGYNCCLEWKVIFRIINSEYLIIDRLAEHNFQISQFVISVDEVEDEGVIIIGSVTSTVSQYFL